MVTLRQGTREMNARTSFLPPSEALLALPTTDPTRSQRARHHGDTVVWASLLANEAVESGSEWI